MLQKLPIGIQSFQKIREEAFLYIDKTQQIYNILQAGDFYFLSRPRRFGKSLTLSTIKEIYSGRKELFKGLWIEDQWDWTKKHPVIHIGFSSIGYRDLGLEKAIDAELNLIAKTRDLVLSEQSIARKFKELITKLSAQNKVVLLIDEYDKPLIDYLDQDQLPQARANQQILKTFYSVIKDSDPMIEFLLITGVSKFSKVSIFSDLNNLLDITLHPLAAILTGYTQSELEASFQPYLKAISTQLDIPIEQLLDQIQFWYNGYSWDGVNTLYNPFSVLVFMSSGQFRNHWFETGTPTFLINLIREQHYYKLDQLEVSERSFSQYDIEHLQVLPLLFQTGYLTIKEKQPMGLYLLDYPNVEVKEALLEYLISDLRHEQTALSTSLVIKLHKAFQANDLEKVISIIKTVFKTIPSQIFIKDSERYYHSLIYLVFFYLGIYSDSEVNTSDGRLDCVVKTPSHIYLLEFKLDKSAEAALEQIHQRNYAGKFEQDERKVVMVGINFSSKNKTVNDWLAAE